MPLFVWCMLTLALKYLSSSCQVPCQVSCRVLVKFLSSSCQVLVKFFVKFLSSSCQVLSQVPSQVFSSSFSSSFQVLDKFLLKFLSSFWQVPSQVLVKFFRRMCAIVFNILKSSTCNRHAFSIPQIQCTSNHREFSLDREVFIQILQKFSFVNRVKICQCFAWKLKKCINYRITILWRQLDLTFPEVPLNIFSRKSLNLILS